MSQFIIKFLHIRIKTLTLKTVILSIWAFQFYCCMKATNIRQAPFNKYVEAVKENN